MNGISAVIKETSRELSGSFFHYVRACQENSSYKDGHNKEQKWYGPNKQKILRSGTKEHTEELYKKKILMTQITTMV